MPPSSATEQQEQTVPSSVTDEERAFTAELSKKAITVRAEPREGSRIEDDVYMSRCDQYLHDALKKAKKPKLADFERLFNAFERHFLDSPDLHPLYRTCLDDMANVDTRLLMALNRYTS